MPAFGANFMNQFSAPGTMGGNRKLLGQAQEAGHFDPMGSPRIRARRRARRLQLDRALRARSGTAAGLYGLDAMGKQNALMQAELMGNQGLAEGLAGEDLQEDFGARDFSRELYRGELDFQRQRALQAQAEKAASRGAMGQLTGGLIGTAAHFIPGYK